MCVNEPRVRTASVCVRLSAAVVCTAAAAAVVVFMLSAAVVRLCIIHTAAVCFLEVENVVGSIRWHTYKNAYPGYHKYHVRYATASAVVLLLIVAVQEYYSLIVQQY